MRSVRCVTSKYMHLPYCACVGKTRCSAVFFSVYDREKCCIMFDWKFTVATRVLIMSYLKSEFQGGFYAYICPY